MTDYRQMGIDAARDEVSKFPEDDDKRARAKKAFATARRTDGNWHTYYIAYGEEMLNLIPKPIVVATPARKTNRRDPWWENVKRWKEAFSRVFEPRRLAWAATASRSDNAQAPSEEPSPESDSHEGSGSVPQHPPSIIPILLAGTIGLLVGSWATKDFGIGLIIAGMAAREAYARTAEDYKPALARVIGLALPALTLLGTMWQFGVALVVHFWVWQQIPWFYAEDQGEGEGQKPNFPHKA